MSDFLTNESSFVRAAVYVARSLMIKSPRQRAVSLVGTLRPGRRSQYRAVAGALVADLLMLKLLSSVLLAHRRQREATRCRGSQRDTSLSVSPARRRSPKGPSKSRWSAPAVRGCCTALPCSDFASGRLGLSSLRLARAAARSRGECRRAGRLNHPDISQITLVIPM